MKTPNGVILYRGPSELNGRPIVVIVTGLAGKGSENNKTGAALQVWILADNGETPTDAILSGADVSVCGNCPHRPAPGKKVGTCYVLTFQAPHAVYDALRRGTYPRFNPVRHSHLFRGRTLRLGAYGDPAAVPLSVLERFATLSGRWLAYTHQWRECPTTYSRYCMASCETEADRTAAVALGYRTFRVRLASQPLTQGEFTCPASAEAGKRMDCVRCGACSGALSGGRNASPSIVFHGAEAGGNWKLRAYEAIMAAALTRDAQQAPPAPSAGRRPLQLV